jgi:hypothetical protein
MTSSTMMWAGILGAAALALRWWDLVDLLLDRVGPPSRAGAGPQAAISAEVPRCRR